MKKLVYHRLRFSTESKIIGIWPQLDVPKHYFKVPDNFEILTSRHFPEVKPNLENFIFKRGAKRTDVLSAYLPDLDIGVFVNQKFSDLLSDFDSKSARFYPCSLIAADKNGTEQLVENPYSFLHVIHANEIIDFKQSVFEDLKTNQMTAVENQEQVSPFLYPVKLFLKETPDLFRSPFNIALLVSESLKQAMEKAAISGVWFEEFKGNEFYSAE